MADPEGVGELEEDSGRRGAGRRGRAARGVAGGDDEDGRVGLARQGEHDVSQVDVVAVVARLVALLGDGAGRDLAEVVGDEVGDLRIALAARRAIGSGS